MKMSIFPLLLLSLIAWKSSADSAIPNTDVDTLDNPVLQVIRVELPDYRAMFENIQDVKDNKEELKRELLTFYSTLLPVLRKNAFSHRIYEAEVAYTLAEPSGYDLVKLHLVNVDSMTADEHNFFERVVLNNSYSAAQKLVLDLLPQIPETVDAFTGDQVVVKNTSLIKTAVAGGRYE